MSWGSVCPSGAQATRPCGGWDSTGCLASPGCDATTVLLFTAPGQSDAEPSPAMGSLESTAALGCCQEHLLHAQMSYKGHEGSGVSFL